MTELEMVASYRQAASKAKQIKILAELGVCSVLEIVEMLRRNGETVHNRTIGALNSDPAPERFVPDEPEPVAAPLPEPEPEPVSNLDRSPERYEEISVPASPGLILTARETATLKRLVDLAWETPYDHMGEACRDVVAALDFVLTSRCGDDEL